MGERGANRIVATVALAAFVLGLGYAVRAGLAEDDPAPTTTEAARPSPTPPARPRPKPPRPRPAVFVRLTAAGAFDPEGDGRERDEEARLAVDGRPATSWRTERYQSFFKDGVGLVLDARRSVRVEQVIVQTPAPGYRAEIRLGARRRGPFRRVAAARTVASTTRFAVPSRRGRYVVVWIVGLPPDSAAVVSEVRVRAR